MTTSLLSLGAVTVAAYQVRTGDTTSAASSVSAALLEAESLISEDLRRDLPLDTRTESMIIRALGRLYPRAWPITACTSNVIDGRTLLGGMPDMQQFVVMIGVPGYIKPRATVTYTGGFDASTLPVALAHAIYDLAGAVLSRSAVSVPAGATSVSVGDVSISFASGDEGLDTYVPGLIDRIGRYRNRFV